MTESTEIKQETVHSKKRKAMIKITPMYEAPGVLREYRLQPKIQEADYWSNVDFVGFFGKKYPERYKTFPEAHEAAQMLVDRVEDAWS